MAEKVAIVTAGGSGMGAAAARQLAGDGYHIAVLSSGKGEALARELVALLASDRTAYITRQNIRRDGGITRSV